MEGRRETALLFGGLALIFGLLLIRPADWVNLVAGVAPGQPLLAWLASNSGLWAVLAAWLLTTRLLARTED